MSIISPRGTLPQGVKPTSGGTFNPDDPLTFFIASNPDMLETADYPTVLIAVNELESAKARDRLDRFLDTGRQVFLDSGIFNLAMEHVRKHGTSHNDALRMPPDEIDGFNRLWDLYGDIATTYTDRLWGVVELDQGGVDNKPVTRARIETEFGITPIPVYHPLLDGWDYYDTLAKGYDRICFGNIVQAAPGARLRLAHTAMERARDYPYLWTHLLGLYPSHNSLALRMRGSMDASSWLKAIRWHPSWRGWSMLQSVTGFPTTMWSHKGGDENYDRLRGEALCWQTASAAQMTLDAVLEDTHQ